MNSHKKIRRLFRCEQCTHKWVSDTFKRVKMCPVCKSKNIGFFKKKEEK